MTLYDRIKGALYGFALGDALGLGTEFMTRAEIAAVYPNGVRGFDGFLRDAHRSQWKRGEWTNDTDILIAQLRSIIRHGTYEESEFARDFKECIDTLHLDVQPLLRAIISTPGWVDDPIEVADKRWSTLGCYGANNEALHRGLVAGLAGIGTEIYDWTRPMVISTNKDSRCVSSATVLAMMANSLLHTGEPADYHRLLSACYSIDGRTAPFVEIAHSGTLEDLELDDEDTMAFTRKGMASALWAVWHCDNAPDYIYKIIDQGGDADSNAAISGLFAGLRYGFDALPEIKNEIVRSYELEDLARDLTEYVEKKKNKQNK